MKSLLLLLAAAALFMLAACPKQPGQPAAGEYRANPGAKAEPTAPVASAPPAAQAPESPGAPKGKLELDGLYVGLDIGSVLKHIPPQWQTSPTWAPGAKDRTGIVTYNAPPTPPVKGAVTPPAVSTFAFLDGKLVAAKNVRPGTSQADYDRWSADTSAKFGAPSAALPEFAGKCEFLTLMNYSPPDGKSVVWTNTKLQQVLALQYSPSMGMAIYLLADVQGFNKVQQATMSPAGNSAPAPQPGS